MPTIQKIVPCLWFDSQAEEAAKFYVSNFERSRIVKISHFGNEGQDVHGRKPGSVMTVAFELEGAPFTALNGGPLFQFTPAISIQVMCETQDEIDRLWTKLSAGGDEKAQQCGWLKDQYGLSWQIAPAMMADWMGGDQVRADRAMKAMLKMKKLDIAQLKQAWAG